MFALGLAVGAAGCSLGGAPPSPFSAQPAFSRNWISPIAREHPLVGRIFDVSSERWASREELARAIVAADVVLLGEQHDNADHHQIQALLLTDLLGAGRRPVVAFEQINLEDQAALDAAVAGAERARVDLAGADGGVRSSGDTNGVREAADWAIEGSLAVAKAAGWDRSGWPPFEQYQPIFVTALGAGLPLRAANLSRAALADKTAIPEAATQSTTAPVVLSGAARASLAAEIEESHCGYAVPEMVDAMVEAQRRRDDAMATVILSSLGGANGAASATAGQARATRTHGEARTTRASATKGQGTDGVVLISGFGHARRGYGVPLHLSAQRPELRVVSVALVEVVPDRTAPLSYAELLHAQHLPFDFVIFTPRADDEDACEKFRASLEKMRAPRP